LSRLSTEFKAVSVDLLEENPLNPNQMSSQIRTKLKRHIKLTGKYPPLVVRRISANRLRVIDGHQRLSILRSLGYEIIECVIWDCDDDQELMFLATINNMRGEDNYSMRTRLLRRLDESLERFELHRLLPDERREIDWRLDSAAEDPQTIAKQINERLATANAATSFGILVFRCDPAETELIEQAIEVAGGVGLRSRGKALAKIAENYLED